jgi:hypothetical protein
VDPGARPLRGGALDVASRRRRVAIEDRAPVTRTAAGPGQRDEFMFVAAIPASAEVCPGPARWPPVSAAGPELDGAVRLPARAPPWLRNLRIPALPAGRARDRVRPAGAPGPQRVEQELDRPGEDEDTETKKAASRPGAAAQARARRTGAGLEAEALVAVGPRSARGRLEVGSTSARRRIDVGPMTARNSREAPAGVAMDRAGQVSQVMASIARLRGSCCSHRHG